MIKVTLYSRDPRIVKEVENLNAPDVEISIPRILISGGLVPDDLPRRADLVITTGQLNKKTEMFAMRMGAMCVVLPEAYDWLSQNVGRYTTLVGVDLADPSKAVV